jgi:queuine tRNA-ribosyltransferase
LKFEIVARDPGTRARAGLLHTAHGVIETPAFMPVGTAGSVKGMTQDELERVGVQILLANTYHLYLRPGHEVVRATGGLHRFMAWPHPILTDSGGFQVMSLKGLSRVSKDGVEFRSHLDGSSHFLSPERAVEIQLALGADIIMALDECVEYPASRENSRRALELTGLWARRAKTHYHKTLESTSSESPAPVLFGIVQGGTDKALRLESAQQVLEIGFEGYAVGGLSVGEPKSETYDLAGYTAELLPWDRPRYLMGVGTPADLVECVARGIDLFDCVLPTRNARNAGVFTSEGQLGIKSARYARDPAPLDPACGCTVCCRYSRAYIRHLFQANEMVAAILATHHNLHFYLDTMRKIRQAVASGGFVSLLRRVRTGPLSVIPEVNPESQSQTDEPC